MSINDISSMSVKERVALMEEIWSSFEKDKLEYPTPAWHKQVLEDRTKRADKYFVPFEDTKRSLQRELNEYRNS